MGKNKGVTEVIGKNRKRVTMDDEWFNHLGNLPHNFRMLIEGKPKNGKTSYCLQLTKMLAKDWGKVYYNSAEEGDTASMAEALDRFAMHEVKGRWILARDEDSVFESMMDNLARRNSGRVVVIDSLDYMRLTLEQYKELEQRFRNKAIIIVCWNDPMDIHAKRIRYNVNIAVEIRDFVAFPRSRFGGNKPFNVWKNKPSAIGQLKLF